MEDEVTKDGARKDGQRRQEAAMANLILFDIDGTLVDAGDISRRSFAHVLSGFATPATTTPRTDRTTAGPEDSGPGGELAGHSLSGKTDPQIMRELLLRNGMPTERVARTLKAMLEAYQACYLAGLRTTGIRALDGAKELLAGLVDCGAADHTVGGGGDLTVAVVPADRTAVTGADPATPGPAADRVTAGPKTTAGARPLLGILSGNLRGLIAPKLAAAGIPTAGLRVIACGSDHADRNALPAIAVHRAEVLTGERFFPSQVVIVGDTPLDIECAKRFGATSVAVASGDYNIEQLQTSRPTVLLRSLLEWRV